MARNKKRLKDTPVNWQDIVNNVNREVDRQWIAGLNRVRKRRSGRSISYPNTWMPPLDGELKFNFDAAFKNGHTTVGCVL